MKNKSRLRRRKRGQIIRKSLTHKKSKKINKNIFVKLVEKKDEISEKMKQRPVGAAIKITFYLIGLAATIIFCKNIFTGGLEPEVIENTNDISKLDSTHSKDKEKIKKNISELDYETLRRYEEVKKELEQLSYSQSQLQQNLDEILKQLYEKRNVDEVLKSDQKSNQNTTVQSSSLGIFNYNFDQNIDFIKGTYLTGLKDNNYDKKLFSITPFPQIVEAKSKNYIRLLNFKIDKDAFSYFEKTNKKQITNLFQKDKVMNTGFLEIMEPILKGSSINFERRKKKIPFLLLRKEKVNFNRENSFNHEIILLIEDKLVNRVFVFHKNIDEGPEKLITNKDGTLKFQGVAFLGKRDPKDKNRVYPIFSIYQKLPKIFTQ